MAQRSNNHSSNAVVGIATFWQDQKMEPKMRWKRWQKLIITAMMTKSSIYVEKLIQELGNTAKILILARR